MVGLDKFEWACDGVVVRALPAVIYEMCKSDVFKKGASIVCLVSSVASGQILKRDMLPKKRTRSRIARLLALIGDAPDRFVKDITI